MGRNIRKSNVFVNLIRDFIKLIKLDKAADSIYDINYDQDINDLLIVIFIRKC